jgi:hypothetical protein
MAFRIAALNHYRPMIAYRKTANWQQVADYIAMRTGLNRGEIIMVLTELHDAILFYNGQGQGVKLEGPGTYLPNINYQGEFDVAYRMDSQLKRALNAGDFSGRCAISSPSARARTRSSPCGTANTPMTRWNKACGMLYWQSK